MTKDEPTGPEIGSQIAVTRIVFMAYERANRVPHYIEHVASQPNPVRAGVIVDDTIVEVTAYNNGRIEVTRRRNRQSSPVKEIVIVQEGTAL